MRICKTLHKDEDAHTDAKGRPGAGPAFPYCPAAPLLLELRRDASQRLFDMGDHVLRRQAAQLETNVDLQVMARSGFEHLPDLIGQVLEGIRRKFRFLHPGPPHSAATG